MVMSLSLRESSIIFILGSQEEEICTPMFTAELFTIAKTWKQPKYPLTDEWIKKMWYIYTVEYYSATTKRVIMPFIAT